MKLSDLRKLMECRPMTMELKDNGQREEYLRSMGMEPGKVYQELEMDSALVDTHRDYSFGDAQMDLHSHSFYEILFCRSNCGAEYLVGTNRYRLQKGDVIVVAPGVSHRPLLPKDMTEPYSRDVLWISEDFMQALRTTCPELLTQSCGDRALLRTAGTRWESLGELFLRGVEEARGSSGERPVALLGNTITLLTQLHRAYTDRMARPAKAEKPELLDRVMEYVETHLSDKITIADVAHVFYVSESTIIQTFRKKMGVSFYRCVTQRRLIVAKSLIAQGQAMEAVAEQVGFSDYSTFYRAFRQEFGISPRQYRKMLEQ